ncbi:catalase family peroxidase [Ramlibacter tataouinensis]|uniref:Catalase-related peroxidase n=1 Tax=Ramlibacter tataouinensis (strain ATCC BAA-407 / DSM 14655 / LMG 21543 / TTB310) TaxID=365046 RepID=F5XWV5_RAMTT|nr:catalase family peroxidase [Ramlibacter tataouinensis]AEG91716.1 Hydroxyperoxidase II-like protein [Ramlibacter tataouinensis TTB310]
MKKIRGCHALTLACVAIAGGANAQVDGPDTNERLVNVMEKLAGGPHKGHRANHAKGIVVRGVFVPTAAAAALSKAPHFNKGSVPVTARFSNSTGVPSMPDADGNASPRGIALRFHYTERAYTDIVSISYNGFPSATPEQFLDFLNAVARSGPKAAKPTPIERYLAAHPKARQFVTTPKPMPVSFARQSFYGVNAFRFINAQGDKRYIRYQILPVEGEQFIADRDAARLPANHLFDELRARLPREAAQFRLVAQLAQPADPINDGSQVWPTSRETVDLGRIVLTTVVEDSAGAERRLQFNPLILTEGIEPSDDPILLARPEAYTYSIERRSQP